MPTLHHESWARIFDGVFPGWLICSPCSCSSIDVEVLQSSSTLELNSMISHAGHGIAVDVEHLTVPLPHGATSHLVIFANYYYPKRPITNNHNVSSFSLLSFKSLFSSIAIETDQPFPASASYLTSSQVMMFDEDDKQLPMDPNPEH